MQVDPIFSNDSEIPKVILDIKACCKNQDVHVIALSIRIQGLAIDLIQRMRNHCNILLRQCFIVIFGSQDSFTANGKLRESESKKKKRSEKVHVWIKEGVLDYIGHK